MHDTKIELEFVHCTLVHIDGVVYCMRWGQLNGEELTQDR